MHEAGVTGSTSRAPDVRQLHCCPYLISCRTSSEDWADVHLFVPSGDSNAVGIQELLPGWRSVPVTDLKIARLVEEKESCFIHSCHQTTVINCETCRKQGKHCGQTNMYVVFANLRATYCRSRMERVKWWHWMSKEHKRKSQRGSRNSLFPVRGWRILFFSRDNKQSLCLSKECETKTRIQQ